MNPFRPAIVLMNRLSFSRKFALFGVPFLAIATLLIFNLHTSLDERVQAMSREIDGLRNIGSLFTLMRHIQQYRGLAAMGEDTRLADAREFKEMEVEFAFEELAGHLAGEPRLPAVLDNIAAEWASLKQYRGALSWDSSHILYTVMIEQLLSLEADIADTFALSLDPDPGTHYLVALATHHVPFVLERLGRVRARGALFLATTEDRAEHQRRLDQSLADLDHAQTELRATLRKAIRYNPALKTTLQVRYDTLGQQFRQVHELSAGIIDGTSTLSSVEYFSAVTRLIDFAYLGVERLIIPGIEAQLQERIDQARATLRMSLGLTVFTALVICYFAIGGYLASRRTIRQLVHAARAFSAGRLTQRVTLETRGELAEVGETMNTMAAGFSALLEKRHAAEAELRRANAAANAANRAKDQLLANVSHELRTPMNAIVGMAQLCLTGPSDAAEQRDRLEKITTAATALQRLIDDLLEISRAQAGELPLETIPFALSDVFDKLTMLTATSLRAKPELRLSMASAADVPNALIGDPLRLGQILLNLTANAIKFTARGTVSLRVTVADETPEAGDDTILLRFTLRDTGIGLNPEQIDRLFEPFVQADASISRRYGGTGLGLAISRRLAQSMGGDITASGASGEGATFILTARFGRAHAGPVPTTALVVTPTTPSPPTAAAPPPQDRARQRLLLQRAQAQLAACDLGIEDTLRELCDTAPLPPAEAKMLDDLANLVANYDYEPAHVLAHALLAALPAQTSGAT